MLREPGQWIPRRSASSSGVNYVPPPLQVVEALRDYMVVIATTTTRDEDRYRRVRSDALANPQVAPHLPLFVGNATTAAEFWAFIKAESDSYAGRRTFLAEAFTPLIRELESAGYAPQIAVPKAPATLAALRTAFGTYTVVRQIGQGAVGRVFEVRAEDGVLFAAKVMLPTAVTTTRLKRFKNEVFFCLRSQHRNVLRVVDYGLVLLETVEVPFYIMPKMGSTLRDRIRAEIPPEDAFGLFVQLLDGIEAAHLQGVWHRDLKPANVLLSPDGKTAVVADFGAAHFAEGLLATVIETQPHDRLANFEYAAPEQRRPGAMVDARCDIYALGQILNELFTGRVPHGEGYTRIIDVAPEYAFLDELVAAMRQDHPDRRPATIDAIKRSLIGRRAEGIARQRLDLLAEQVVPVGGVEDDELVRHPVEVADVDYRAGVLEVSLRPVPSRRWIDVFKSPRAGRIVAGAGATDFRFDGRIAAVSVNEHQAKEALDCFKEWLPRVNDAYRVQREAEERAKQDALARELHAAREEEERRQRVLRDLRGS